MTSIRIVLVPTVLLLLPLTSMCGKKRPVISSPPPAVVSGSTTRPASEPESVPPSEAEKVETSETAEDVPPAEVPEDPPVRSPLLEADRAFLAGDYENASTSYRLYLDENPETAAQTRVLFRLGVCHAIVGQAGSDGEHAMEYFDRVIAESPESPYSIQARLILDLFSQLESSAGRSKQDREEIGRLRDQLEKLKRIDLSRRPPG